MVVRTPGRGLPVWIWLDRKDYRIQVSRSRVNAFVYNNMIIIVILDGDP